MKSVSPNLKKLVESLIATNEGACYQIVLADFRERYQATEAKARGRYCRRWVHIYQKGR